MQEDDIRKAFEKIREQHGAVVNSKEVIGVKVAQPIDRTGEGNGTRERQETRAGIQDGSYMQVKHVQTLIHFHFHWVVDTSFLDSNIIPAPRYDMTDTKSDIWSDITAKYNAGDFRFAPLSEILPSQERHYISSQKQEQQV